MSNLKNQLIKLGSEKPELRHHLKKILAGISKTSANYTTTVAVFYKVRFKEGKYLSDFANHYLKDGIKKHPDAALGRIFELEKDFDDNSIWIYHLIRVPFKKQSEMHNAVWEKTSEVFNEILRQSYKPLRVNISVQEWTEEPGASKYF